MYQRRNSEVFLRNRLEPSTTCWNVIYLRTNKNSDNTDAHQWQWISIVACTTSLLAHIVCEYCDYYDRRWNGIQDQACQNAYTLKTISLVELWKYVSYKITSACFKKHIMWVPQIHNSLISVVHDSTNIVCIYNSTLATESKLQSAREI